MDLFDLGLLGLFIGTFLSATLIPFPSEVILIGMLEAGISVYACLVVATAGNFLGSITNYVIGYLGNSETLIKFFKLNQTKLDLWESRLSEHGVYLGLLAWLPIVGDPMVAALGFFRVKFIPLAALMLLGKFARYLVMCWFYL